MLMVVRHFVLNDNSGHALFPFHDLSTEDKRTDYDLIPVTVTYVQLNQYKQGNRLRRVANLAILLVVVQQESPNENLGCLVYQCLPVNFGQ